MQNRLTLNTFASAGSDAESCQYRILACLKSYYEEFSHNRIYPYLTELIELVTNLQTILTEIKTLEERFPRTLAGIDLQSMKLITSKDSPPSPDIVRFLEVVDWALPRLRKAIEEGSQIFDFVDESMSLAEVGLLPLQQGEGYVFAPDNARTIIHIIKYDVSLYETGGDRYRSIKTRLLKSIPQGSLRSDSRTIKIEIVREHPELPNPATFELQTELDFPFTETILPVAKRKLMAKVAA